MFFDIGYFVLEKYSVTDWSTRWDESAERWVGGTGLLWSTSKDETTPTFVTEKQNHKGLWTQEIRVAQKPSQKCVWVRIAQLWIIGTVGKIFVWVLYQYITYANFKRWNISTNVHWHLCVIRNVVTCILAMMSLQATYSYIVHVTNMSHTQNADSCQFFSTWFCSQIPF